LAKEAMLLVMSSSWAMSGSLSCARWWETSVPPVLFAFRHRDQEPAKGRVSSKGSGAAFSRERSERLGETVRAEGRSRALVRPDRRFKIESRKENRSVMNGAAPQALP
jgi:hypothetical protein